MARLTPESGAVVMGTGIVSVGLQLDGRELASRVLLAAGVLAWFVLGVLAVRRALVDRRRLRQDARSPAALTAVAGTAVLGTRFTLLGWTSAGIALLGVALLLWLVLLWPVLANWVTPTRGVSLVLAVSTESLAVLGALTALHQHSAWLLQADLVPFVLGLVFYAAVIARFDLRQLTTGRGDQWIAGGALAIATVAASRITIVAAALGTLAGVHDVLRVTSLALWGLTLAWLPVLVIAEVRQLRLAYDVRRWATIFPLGMYAACSFLVGAAAGVPAATDFARSWIWVAVAAWLAAAVAMLRRGLRLVSRRSSRFTAAPK